MLRLLHASTNVVRSSGSQGEVSRRDPAGPGPRWHGREPGVGHLHDHLFVPADRGEITAAGTGKPCEPFYLGGVAELRTNHLPMRERLLYTSENGDCWSLVRESVTREVFVRHRANLPSGGQVSDVSLGAFLVQGGLGPEKQELLHLIGSLTVDEQR